MPAPTHTSEHHPPSESAKMPIEKACGAIVFRGKKFLLLKPTKSKNWGAPRGRMEKGENEEQTARREIFEETGLKNLVFLPRFRHVNKYIVFRGKKPLQRHVVFFLGETKSGDVVLSEEHSDFEWLDFRESIQRVKFPALKAILYLAAQRLEPGFTYEEPEKED